MVLIELGKDFAGERAFGNVRWGIAFKQSSSLN
jgi:hypothetical protein